MELLTPFKKEFDEESLKKFLVKQDRVRGICFTNSNKVSSLILEGCFVEYTNKAVVSSHNCGNINPKNFMVNANAFFESKNHNSCLNRKISIDKNGNIRNCPAMEKVYGQVGKKDLEEVVKLKEFKSFWDIKKDQISVCMDCEFRHICSDCRAFLNKNELYNKPKKCNYDPYSATWS